MDDKIQSIVTKLGASSGAIMVVDEQAKVLRCAASYNMPDAWVNLVNKLEIAPGNSNGTVACTGKVSIENNLNEMFHGHLLDSVIVVPVKSEGRVVANIEIVSDKKDRTFDVADRKYLETQTKSVLVLLKDL